MDIIESHISTEDLEEQYPQTDTVTPFLQYYLSAYFRRPFSQSHIPRRQSRWVD